MWISSKFDGLKEIKRLGVCDKVIYDDTKNIDSMIDKENKQIVIGKKSKSFVLTDEIGIKGELSCTAFLVNKGIIIEIEKGSVYLKSKHNQIFSVDNTGEIEITSDNEDIMWKTIDEINDLVKNLVRSKFYLDNHRELISKYVENLAYAFNINYKNEAMKEFKFKLVDCYTTLSLGEIEFKDYSDEKKSKKMKKQEERIEKNQDDEEYITFGD